MNNQPFPSWAKGVLAVAGVVGGGFLLYKLTKILTGETRREIREASNVASELQAVQNSLSYPASQYDTLANIIETAGFDVGTDEDAIYNVFRKLNNNADYLALTKAWGNRTIYDWGIPDQYTLAQYLTYELGADEIQRVNNILNSKGITYRV